jgi:signal transduction histidine kinase
MQIAFGATVANAMMGTAFYAMVAGEAALTRPVIHVMVTASVLTGVITTLVSLLLEHGASRRATTRLGLIRTLAPPAFAPLSAIWLAPPTPEGWPVRVVIHSALALACAGLLVAQLVRRLLPWLHGLEVRRSGGSSRAHLMQESLAGNLGRLLFGMALIAVALATGMLLASMPVDRALSDVPAASIALLTFLATLTVAAFAGVSVGRSPGRDVRSVARRLDALGYEARTAMTWPFAVTSADDLGQLFRELDRLRQRLAGEVQLYQSALDRTRDADTAKANFLAAVSHEVRTPLNSVEGYSQLLLEGIPSPLTEPQGEDVRLIRAGARQLLGLINDILDISMIESGDLRLTFGEHDPAKLIREVVAIHQPLVRQDDKVIVADCPEDLPMLICDRRRLGQVLNNLVSNAIKFTEVGSITLRASYTAGDDHLLIRAIDTGMGISEDELALVFEEFRQVGELKRRVKGTGLGLAIARSIAEAHGGELSATSELGVGSTFTLKLPLRPPATPDKIDMTEARVRAQERLKNRTGKIPRYTTPVESSELMSLADVSRELIVPADEAKPEGEP